MKWPCRSEREQIIEKDKILYEIATAWRAANVYRNDPVQKDQMRYAVNKQRLENALNSLSAELLDEGNQ